MPLHMSTANRRPASETVRSWMCRSSANGLAWNRTASAAGGVGGGDMYAAGAVAETNEGGHDRPCEQYRMSMQASGNATIGHHRLTLARDDDGDGGVIDLDMDQKQERDRVARLPSNKVSIPAWKVERDVVAQAGSSM